MASIVVTKDQMRAELCLEADETVTAEEALALLGQAGVAYGIRMDALPQVTGLVGPASVLVAEGQYPVPGVDAVISYAAGLLAAEASADRTGDEETENSANSTLKRVCFMVRAGDVLARRIPPVPPKQGITVRGQWIQPEFPIDLVLRPGEGTHVTSDGHAVIATIEGCASLHNDIVIVRPLVLLDGDLHPNRGPLKIDGDVLVTGSINRQVELVASGNVTVEGSVEGARIVSGGNVEVSGGVRNQSHIEARGDVAAQFFEGCTLNSSGSMRVAENLLHSFISIKGSLEAGGAIIGGNIQVGQNGNAAVLGSKLGTPTTLHVCPPVADSQQQESIHTELAKINSTLVTLTARIRDMQAAMTKVSPLPSQKEQLRKMLELAKLLRDKEAALIQRKVEETVQNITEPTFFNVNEMVYPGVVLKIGIAAKRFEATFPAGTFTAKENVIEFGALSPPDAP